MIKSLRTRRIYYGDRYIFYLSSYERAKRYYVDIYDTDNSDFHKAVWFDRFKKAYNYVQDLGEYKGEIKL